MQNSKRWTPRLLLVAAVGKPRMITGAMVKPGAVVIDVGMNRLPDGKLNHLRFAADGNIYLPDFNGLPGAAILVDPAEPEDLSDPDVLNLDKG